MEILTPVDCSFIAEKSKEEFLVVQNKAKADLKSLLPIGYTLRASGGYVHVYRTNTHTDIIFSYISSNQVTVSYQAGTTALDIYRLCGVAQLLICCDLHILEGLEITN